MDNQQKEQQNWANGSYERPKVIEDRPDELDCDVVRFQNNRDKWVAFVGLLDGRPYEIFTGLQDDDEGIVLPKTVTKGKIIRQTNPDGTHRYDFQFENGAIRRLLRACPGSSIPNTGTMQSLSPVCCVMACLSTM